MRNFGGMGFNGLVAVAAMAVGMSSASALEITSVTGTTATSTSDFLRAGAGTGLGGVYAYSVNLPTIGSTAICFGGSMDCPATTLTGSGYLGSNDVTFQQNIGGVNQTITWGTSNGNVSPVQAISLDDSFGNFPLDNTGNSTQVNGGSYFGWTGGFSLGTNGNWTAPPPLIGVNSGSNFDYQTDSVYLYFDTPIAGFAALFNYNSDGFSSPTISAYDGTGNLVNANTDMISFSGSAEDINTGVLYGFLEPTALISMIVLTDANAVMTNLSITYGEAAPEPISLALLGTGLVGLGVVRRLRKIKSA